MFSVSISFPVSIENYLCYPNKEKTYKAVVYFPLSIQMNILKLNNNRYIILTTYMLDSALEPSYSYCHEIDSRYGK